MPRRRRKEKRGTRVKLYALVITLGIASCAVFATAERPTPQIALSQLKREAKDASLGIPQMEGNLKAAAKAELPRSWAFVIAARELDEAGDKRAALELLESNDIRESDTREKGHATISLSQSIDSAADYEQLLLRTRLQVELEQAVTAPVEECIAFLPKIVDRFRRKDLEPEVLYTLALLETRAKKYKEASQHVLELRERFPTSLFVPAAKLLAGKLHAVNLPEMAEQLFGLREVDLLVKERDFSVARQKLEEFRKGIEKNSSAYFDSFFTEENLLRRSGEPLKADDLLLSLAADAPELQASKSLFKAAKNAWNENNSHYALELLDQLFHRFPKSLLLTEAHYTEGRILEELGKLREAEKIYESFSSGLERSKDSAELITNSRAVKRAVWLKFGRRDFESAASLAGKALGVFVKVPPAQLSAELRLDENGYKYWRARSLAEMKNGSLESKKLFEDLQNSDRRGFYGILSREILARSGEAPPSFFPEQSPDCQIEPSEEFRQQIASLSGSELRDLAQREIDFFFGMTRGTASKSDQGALITAQSLMSSELGLPSTAVELAEEGLRVERLSDAPARCSGKLARLAFQAPYLSSYLAEEKAHRLDASIALAISRSESFFNPEAVSAVGALGLMQLMPDTAKREGWTTKTPLTDANTNISLGVKHLARLSGEYQGDLFKIAAAYNAGSSAVNRWISRYEMYPRDMWVEFIGYPETNKYVRRVYAAKQVYEEIIRQQEKGRK